MKNKVNRRAVDLSAFPELVVIYLGMRVNTLMGFRTLIGFGPKISSAVAEKPEGLLLHESIVYSLRHIGMRQYWRDFESLEDWARSLPHREWWQEFLQDSGGTGFWHETYFQKGGMEAIYSDMKAPLGFMKFAPVHPARGAMFSARRRLNLGGESVSEAPVLEADYYQDELKEQT